MNLQEGLVEIISQSLGVDKKDVTLESNFYSDFNAGRLEVADLILACQQKFKTALPENAIDEIKNVEDLSKLIEESSDEI